MFLSVYRTSKFAVTNFRRNLWLSVVTIFILVLTLFTISLLAGVNLTAAQAINAIKEKIDVDIFFNVSTAEDKILEAQIYLKNLDEVKEVKFVSQDMALEQFKAKHEDDADIQISLEELDKNPLPASLVITAQNLDDYETIINKFEESPYNEYAQSKDFVNHQVVIERLNSLILRVYQFGLALTAIFIVISIIVVFNTVRLTIYSHRDELGIMKLVGATNWFIRAPFLLEGILYALIASILTMLIFYPLLVAVAPYVNTFFAGYNFDLLNFAFQYFWHIFALQLFISLILSLTSTSIAISRHLNV